MNKMDGKSFDNVADILATLQSVAPGVFNEGRLDQDALLTILGEEFDNDNEKYQFTWKGKQESLQLAQKRSSGTLRPSVNESKDWENTNNLYIEGDNLEVLKLLQKGYLRQIKMIYIDPPYNTGNDFVYKDDFKDPISAYKESTMQDMKANPETAGRYHSNWLSMMYPRLKLAKTLLKDDGVIFISIDDNEVHNLRKICDEIFGEENFVAEVVWKRKRGRDNSAKWFSKSHEYLLIYARNKDNFNTNFLELDDETKQAYKNPDNDPRGDYRMLGCWARGTQGGVKYDFTTKDGKYFGERLWLFSKENLIKMDLEDKLVFHGDNVYRKLFIHENKGKIPETIWEDVSNAANAADEIKKLFGDIIFDTPKPIPYIMEMLKIATNSSDNDIVLDFFAGSSSTAHAVMQLNSEDEGDRQFIMVQIPERLDEKSAAFQAGFKTISDIGKERIRRAGEKIKSENPLTAQNLDTGFRVFKLDSSNMIKWDDDFAKMNREQQTATLLDRMNNSMEELKSDRREIDFVYEILLKYGIALTEPLATTEINGKKFYAVGEDRYLFICLDKDIGVETIEKLVAEHTPGTVVFADRCFANDDDISNTTLILKKAEIEFRWI